MPGDPTSFSSQPRRLLVRGVNWLGDSVMTTPALQRLRAAFPASHIALLTPQKLADLWLHHPSLNAVHTFMPGEGLWPVARRLRQETFDAALVLPNSPRSALEVWLAGIPRRVGYPRAWRKWFLSEAVPLRMAHVRMRKRSVREIRRLVRTSLTVREDKVRDAEDSVPTEGGGIGDAEDSVPTKKQRDGASGARYSDHQVHEYLHLAAALGASSKVLPPLLVTAPDEVQAVRSKFGLNDPSGTKRPLLALNPGAEYGPAKRWPTERFVAAACQIRERTHCAWLLLGGESDASITAEMHAALRTPKLEVHDLAGKTSLRELMSLLKLCRVLLTNDSGPMHVAAALGTRVVVPFGSTSFELTGPGLPGDSRHHLLRAGAPCAPCFRRTCPIDFRCMMGLPVDRVVGAVLEALAASG